MTTFSGFMFKIVKPVTNGGDGIPGFGIFFCVFVVVTITSVIARKKYPKKPF